MRKLVFFGSVIVSTLYLGCTFADAPVIHDQRELATYSPRSTSTTLVVQHQPNAKHNRLIIPRRLLMAQSERSESQFGQKSRTVIAGLA